MSKFTINDDIVFFLTVWHGLPRQIFLSRIAGAGLLLADGGLIIDFSPGTISWTWGGSGAGAGLDEQPASMKNNRKQEKNIRVMKKISFAKKQLK